LLLPLLEGLLLPPLKLLLQLLLGVLLEVDCSTSGVPLGVRGVPSSGDIWRSSIAAVT
jgi:hypothetical protein